MITSARAVYVGLITPPAPIPATKASRMATARTPQCRTADRPREMYPSSPTRPGDLAGQCPTPTGDPEHPLDGLVRYPVGKALLGLPSGMEDCRHGFEVSAQKGVLHLHRFALESVGGLQPLLVASPDVITL